MADSSPARGNKSTTNGVERKLAESVDGEILQKSQKRARRTARSAEIDKLLAELAKMTDAEKAGLVAVMHQNAELTSKVSDLEAQFKASQATTSTHESDLDRARKELKQARGKIEELDYQLGPLKELQDKFQQHCDAEDEANREIWMKAGASQANKELEACKKKLAEEQARVAQYTADLMELVKLRAKSERLDKIEEELGTTKASLISTQGELDNAKSEVAQKELAISELTKALEQKLDKSRDQIEVLSREASESEAKRAQAESEVSKITTDLKSCKRQYMVLNGSYNSLQDNLTARAEDIRVLHERLKT